MISGTQSFLCEILSCGSADLEILDRIGYRWEEILDQIEWPRDGLDFNDVLRGAISVGIINLKETISDRILEPEAEEGFPGSLSCEEAEELKALRLLRPDDDIWGDCNFLATRIWLRRNGSLYRRYLKKALKDFETNVGFFLTGGECVG